MRISTWLRPLIVRLSRPRPRRLSKHPAFCPCLEALEDRLTPSGGGLLDPTFGSGGVVASSFSSTADKAFSLVVQPDGKIVAAGFTYNSRTNNDFLVTRYNPDGSLDSSFGSGGKTATDFYRGDDAAKAVALQPNTGGKILVAGYDTSSHGNLDFALARYNTNGTLDTTFGQKGKVVTDIANSNDAIAGIAVQSDGKIVAAGTSQTASGTYLTLVRYNANGTLDTTFGSGGKVLTSIPAVTAVGSESHKVAVTIQGDGKIVLVGGTTLGGTNGDFVAARFNADGTADAGFGSGGQVVTDVAGGADAASGVALQTDGKVVAVGFAVANNIEQFATVRYNTDGTLDAGFGRGGKVLTSVGPYGASDAMCVAIQSDGKILVGGHAADTRPEYNFALVQYNSDGSLNTTYGVTGTGTVMTPIGTSATASAMAIQSDGKAVLVGDSGGGGPGDPFKLTLARYLPSAPSPSPVQVGSVAATPNPVAAGSTVTLTASGVTTANAGATITSVAFYAVNDAGVEVFLGYALENADGTWTLTWTVNLASGQYTLLALAVDSTGSVSDPLAITLDVQ